MAVQPVRRALISVSDKTGLIDLAQALVAHGAQLISTGGTRRALTEAGLNAQDISEVTGFPEILDGRVKTLHPRVYGGLLAVRDNSDHISTLAEQQIEPIDLVVCNLYPFEKTVAKEGATEWEIIENIDIGGPCMVRAAAKNHASVGIVTDPNQYAQIIEELKTHGGTSAETRKKLAAAAYARTAAYDQAISTWFASEGGSENSFPSELSIGMNHIADLRYGENPHQKAAFYREPGEHGASVATAEILNGKELSYNNILDLDSALNLVREFTDPAAVVIKHNNPCGAAVGSDLESAFAMAYEGDTVSAFGGILGFNRELDAETAMQITEPNRFIECIIAPSYSVEAFEILTTRPKWKKNVRVLRTGPLAAIKASYDYRRIHAGMLVQDRDLSNEQDIELHVKTKRHPTEEEMRDLRFAWIVGKHIKSNAIVLAKGGAVMGVGAGQMSRVDSVHLSTRKAGDRANGCILSSDAFFPFRDNIDAAAKSGITAIIQPGGSNRDQDSIDACDEHGMAMVFTGVRHFRH